MASNNLITLIAVGGLAYLFLRNKGGTSVTTNPAPSGAQIKNPTISIEVVG